MATVGCQMGREEVRKEAGWTEGVGRLETVGAVAVAARMVTVGGMAAALVVPGPKATAVATSVGRVGTPTRSLRVDTAAYL